jgi:hypothetical protein
LATDLGPGDGPEWSVPTYGLRAEASTREANLALGFGIAALPFSVLAGIPAIVLGVLALRRQTPLRWRAWIGLLLGGLSVLTFLSLVGVGVHRYRVDRGPRTLPTRILEVEVRQVVLPGDAYSREGTHCDAIRARTPGSSTNCTVHGVRYVVLFGASGHLTVNRR